jgi:endo-1,4-beta-xylanase
VSGSATITNGNTLNPTSAGTVTVRATIVNGLTASTPYTKDFNIAVSAAFVPVTDITGVPTTATVGTPVMLTGTVVPSTATNRTITWSVKSGSATITNNNNTLRATAAGTVTITATITNGLTATANYTQDFVVTVITRAEEIARRLEDLGLTTTVNGSTVTVTGSHSSSINLALDGGLTLVWNARITGSSSGALINAVGGGTLSIGSDSSIVNATGDAIVTDGDVVINGGEITANGDNAVAVSAGGSVSVNRGAVSANGANGVSIHADGRVSVAGGMVSATGDDGVAVEADGANSTLTLNGDAVIVSDQSVSVSGGVNKTQGVLIEGNRGTVYGQTAIDHDLTIKSRVTLTLPAGAVLKNNAKLTVAGTIDNTSGAKIDNFGTITVSGTLDNENSSIRNYGKIDGGGSIDNTSGSVINYSGASVTTTVSGNPVVNEQQDPGTPDTPNNPGTSDSGAGGGGCSAGGFGAALMLLAGAVLIRRRAK